MKQWLNGVMVGLALGFVISIVYRQQQEEAQARAMVNPLLSKDDDGAQVVPDKLPAARRRRLSRAEEDGDADETQSSGK